MFKDQLLKRDPFFEKMLEFVNLTDEIRNVHVVGGYVRDFLLQEKSKDIDLVVVGSGLKFAKELANFLKVENVNYFENFGTANFIYEGTEIEIVGARKESYERGSRKPIVEDGTLDDDISRRDFTINAMAISLGAHNFGEFVDKFNGINDLNQGLIRTPLNPDITFSDDPLRMLRAIRFACRFGFKIVDQTYQAIKTNASRLSIISQERIVQEMNKILLSKTPSVGLIKLQDTGLLKLFLPELSALDVVEVRDGMGHKNNFFHTVQVVDQTRAMTDDIVTLWAAVLHDLGKARTKKFSEYGWTFHDHENVGAKMAVNIMTRLKLPIQDWAAKIDVIVRYHGQIKALALDENADVQISDAAIRRLVVITDLYLDDLLLFSKCDITTKSAEKRQRYLDNYERLEKRIHEVAQKDHLRNFTVPVSGDEIMQTFNLKPSKPVGQIKEAIKNAILDGVIPNQHDAAREYMFKVAKEYLPNLDIDAIFKEASEKYNETLKNLI